MDERGADGTPSIGTGVLIRTIAVSVSFSVSREGDSSDGFWITIDLSPHAE